MKKYIVYIFKKCIESVMPRNIIRNTLKYDSKTLYVKDTKMCVHGNIYVIGFGKAVLDMTLEIEKILNGSLKKAIVSIPFGTQYDLKNSKICVLEAAKHNIPDQHAVKNTDYIINLLKNLNKDDVLIVSISGGGSALLCSPTIPLADKILTTKLLVSQGASIEELNSVRKALSHVKGGKLINMVKNSTIISLILSDIVSDPISAIACGPTVPNNDPNNLPLEIINHFNLMDKLPSTVINALKVNRSFNNTDAKRIHNYVIGNNTIALQAGLEYTKKDFVSVILTKSIQGNVTLVSKLYSNLIFFVCKLYTDNVNILTLKDELISNINNIDKEIDIEFLTNKVIEASSSKCGLCILSGGEPTVKIQGCGIGGRNQELALRVSVDIEKEYDFLKQFEIMFFSGGTDGIDGPTDACGAFGYPELVKIARSQGLKPSEFIENNDSYGFYSLLNDSNDLLKIGHTGTNVMDLHILIIKPK